MSQVLENKAVSMNVPSGDWHETKGRRFHVAVTREDDGTYSVIALNLPGVGSCGDTPEEALANFEEATRGVIESYESANEAILWKETSSKDIPPGALHKWIIVHV